VLWSKQVWEQTLEDWSIGVHGLMTSYYNVKRSNYLERIKEKKKLNISTAHEIQKIFFFNFE